MGSSDSGGFEQATGSGTEFVEALFSGFGFAFGRFKGQLDLAVLLEGGVGGFLSLLDESSLDLDLGLKFLDEICELFEVFAFLFNLQRNSHVKVQYIYL